MIVGTELRGIAWQHTRAMAPLQTTAQVFSDFRPEVRVVWEARSLWAFGEGSLDDLAQHYDLVLIDHPMIGYAVERGLLLSLDEVLPAEWSDEQSARAVGASHESYGYDKRQWAAAIDAACPVAAARDDLLAAARTERPRTWEEMLWLARSTGRVAVPLCPIDAFALFLGLCANQGEAPLDVSNRCVVSTELGSRVLEQLRELVDAVGDRYLDWNPIDVLTAMTSSDEILFCPHAYGYSNYARDGFAPRRVTFTDFAGPGPRPHAGVTLGGAGLAVSANSAHQERAVEYLSWVSSPECQRTTYVLSGGQPGHAGAWEDETANRVTRGFFRNTRKTIDEAYVRPRHPGMHEFQLAASLALHSFLQGQVGADATLRSLDEAFRASLAAGI
jgi:multiple sugar transport system substrate-binding protein